MDLQSEVYFVNSCSVSLIDTMSCHEKLLIILVGLPGSGKSTFATNLLSGMPEDAKSQWVVANQDTLKSRKRVYSLAEASMLEGRHVIIDRCNFDVEQRAHWVSLARDFPSYKTLCVTLPNHLNLNYCASRATARGNDGIHQDNTNWYEVCVRMRKQYQVPRTEEGIDAIYLCDTDGHVSELGQTLISLSHQ